ncbi:LRR receptor kinase SERK2 [Glycine soja]|uniref:LRR receptor kinase SERK2 n=1 Tax=Glycine soja TaxID=3848 RepID=A0A445EYN2_GLYSO|nr:LRR receptor kinase SERK2 [Glycine soja]
MSEVVRMLEGERLAERWEEWQYVEVNTRQHYARLQRRMKWEGKGGKQLISDESKAIWMNLGYPTQLSACYLWLPLFKFVHILNLYATTKQWIIYAEDVPP